MCKDFSEQQFYSLFPILTLFVSLSASTLSIAPSLIMTKTSFLNLQKARSQPTPVPGHNPEKEPPKRDVNDALMGKNPRPPALAMTNDTSPSGSPAPKKSRNETMTPPPPTTRPLCPPSQLPRPPRQPPAVPQSASARRTRISPRMSRLMGHPLPPSTNAALQPSLLPTSAPIPSM